jgi:hypothetical protein
MAPFFSQDATGVAPITRPTLIFSGSTDTVVSPATLPQQYYDNLQNASEKMHIEMVGGHLIWQTQQGMSLRPTQNVIIRSWFSYWLCSDARFLTYLCGTEASADSPGSNSQITIRESTCPF